jgi:hypothetical protein
MLLIVRGSRLDVRVTLCGTRALSEGNALPRPPDFGADPEQAPAPPFVVSCSSLQLGPSLCRFLQLRRQTWMAGVLALEQMPQSEGRGLLAVHDSHYKLRGKQAYFSGRFQEDHRAGWR